MLIDEMESRLLWDTDYELGDLFLDRSPDQVRAALRLGVCARLDFLRAGLRRCAFVQAMPFLSISRPGDVPFLSTLSNKIGGRPQWFLAA